MYGCLLFLSVYLIKFVDAGENVTEEFGLKMNNNKTATNLTSSLNITLPRDSRPDSHGIGHVPGHVSGHGARHGLVVGYSTNDGVNNADGLGGAIAFSLVGVIIANIVCLAGTAAAIAACVWCCVKGYCCCPKRKEGDQQWAPQATPVGQVQQAYQLPPVQPPQQQAGQGAGYPQQAAPPATGQQEQQIQKQQMTPEITEPVQA